MSCYQIRFPLSSDNSQIIFLYFLVEHNRDRTEEFYRKFSIPKKNRINLKFILNTHHHYDHIGGNLELKKRYQCKIVAFEGDKDRIPEIDILVHDNQTWKADN